MKLVTLRKRREFLRIRGGKRWSTPAFVLETKARHLPILPPANSYDGPRFGFIVTKRLGNAVKRNRIRRRLKAAIVEVGGLAAKPAYDYVVVARAPALDMSFSSLTDLLKTAFDKVHGSGAQHGRKPGKRANKPHISGHEPDTAKINGKT